MNKNLLYRLYSGAFIGICLLPAVLTPFVKADSSKENRALAALPSVKNADGSINFNILSDWGEYFAEHFAFRQQLVTADSRIKTAALGTSPNSDVIDGSDGWLYYGETVDDFLNINTMNSRRIYGICHDLRLINSFCEENGAEFLFTSVPNKNSLYPENMPFNYVPTDAPDNYSLIAEELSGDSFFLDMKEALAAVDSSIPLYHKTDTHWNNLGAYAGHCALMSKLGRNACPAGSGWFTVANGRLGDLAAMIYPAEDARDTQVNNDYQFNYAYQGRFRGLDDISISTSCEGAEGSLLMYRDSFGEAILPYMAEMFGKAEFSRVVPYRTDSIANGEADVVIMEIVERNLPELSQRSPVMAAPVAELPEAPAELYAGEFSEKENCAVINWDDIPIFAENNGSLTLISGALPESFFSGDRHRVLLTIGDKTFEAFSASAHSDCGNGFSAYIPSDTEITSLTVTVDNAEGADVYIEVPTDKIKKG